MANLVPTQVEQLQRIGAYLRQVRQEQGLSLDILANQIFIRPALLQALETGREEQLPEAVFIQGFIRRYAEALGLDGKAISQEFVVTPPPVMDTPGLVTPAETNGAVTPEPAPIPTPPAPKPVPTAATAAAATLAPAAQKPSFTASAPPVTLTTNRSGWPGWLLWLVGVGAVLLIGAGLGMVLGRGSSPQRAEEPAENATQTDAGDPTTVTDGAANDGMNDAPTDAPATEEPPATAAPQAAPIVVTVSLSDRSWLSVVADGRTVYEGTSDQGYEETWTAQDSLVFTTGNAGGVSLAVNGDDPVTLGNSGVVRTLRLSPDSGASELETP